MADELGLEQRAPGRVAKKPKLVECQPVVHEVPARPKRKISRGPPQGSIFQRVGRQVSLLAFADSLRTLAWVTLATIPLLFAIRQFKPGGT